ncbi:MAG: SMC-Scp complex subunit ScpB [Gammaproteobacteria bacterium]
MNVEEVKPIVEALLMVADGPLSLERLLKLLEGDGEQAPSRELLRDTLQALQADYADRGVELAEVASGWRFRARAAYAAQIGRLWEERRPRYTRAFLETLAIIAYRQPITRGEIEHIRGVAVSSNIMRQLLEREWVKVVGHRDVPGRPSVYATTREFLDYFGLRSLAELPTLAELKDIDDFNVDLFGDSERLDESGQVGDDGEAPADAGAGEPASAETAAVDDEGGAGNAADEDASGTTGAAAATG